MKTPLYRRFTISVFSFLTLAIMSTLFLACSQKFVFSISPVEPAAEGSVKVKQDKNDNYKIDLNVIRLAEPGRLSPPKNVYIVWMTTNENGTTNIGQLKSSSSLLSSALKSSLNTVSSVKPKDFFITAEDNAAVQSPNGLVVLKTNAF